MIESGLLKTILDSHGVRLSGEPIIYSEQPDHVYLYIHVSRDSSNRQVPSNMSLKALHESLLEHGISADFLIFDSKSQDVEAGLRATLLHSFGGDVRNAFLSIAKNNVRVWIDPKRQLSEATWREISKKATIFLSQLDLELDSIALVTGENLPGALVLLRAIRQLAPVAIPHLRDHLLEKGFSVPSEDWVKRRLDNIRRNGRIVRLQDGSYVLSLRCIRELGTEKNKRSPDITRLLALNRSGRYS